MNTLVCTTLSLPYINRTLPDWSSSDVQVWHGEGGITGNVDAVISMGISAMRMTEQIIYQFPSAKLFCYNWDTYAWVWNNPRQGEYDYCRYGELLRKAAEIWVPSKCTRRRVKQWWGLDSKVIKSSCPYWDYEDVNDGGYALCTLREIPDPWWGKFEEACSELGIPHKMTMHEQSYEDYQKAVANCSFICSPLYELSTGGLSLLEAYYLGKPCLLSASEWNGARDYLWDRAYYFDAGSREDFIDRLAYMHNDRPKVESDHKQFVTDNYNDRVMVGKMMERVYAVVA